jgi:hypothetical protein
MPSNDLNLILQFALGAGRNPLNTVRYSFLLQDQGVSNIPSLNEVFFTFDEKGKGHYTTYELCQNNPGIHWRALPAGIISRDEINDQIAQARFLAHLQDAQEKRKHSADQEDNVTEELDLGLEELVIADLAGHEEKTPQRDQDVIPEQSLAKARKKVQSKNKKDSKQDSAPWLHANDNKEVCTDFQQIERKPISNLERSLKEPVSTRLQELKLTLDQLKVSVGASFQLLEDIINSGLWEKSRSAEDFPRFLLALLLLKQDENNTVLSEAQKLYAQAFAEYTILTFEAPFTKRGKGDDMGVFQKRCLAFAEQFTTPGWIKIYFLAKSGVITLSPEVKDHILEKLLVLGGTNFYPFITNTTSLPPATLGAAGALSSKAILISREYSDRILTGLQDTENHIILQEGSRYIINHFREILQEGTDLQNGLIQYLQDIKIHGMKEFNSIPYAGYAIEGLLNLFECLPDSDPVASLAGEILDEIFLAHALHTTSDGRGHKPFARRAGQENRSLHYKGPDDVQALYATFCREYDALPFYYQQSLDSRKNGGAKFALTALTASKYTDRLNALLSSLSLQENSYAMTKQNGVAYFSYRSPGYKYMLTGGGAQFSDGKQKKASVNQSKFGSFGLFVTNSLGLNKLSTDVIQANGKFIGEKTTEECIARNITLILLGDEKLSDSFSFSKKHDLNPCLFYDLAVGPSHVNIPESYLTDEEGNRKEINEFRERHGVWSVHSVPTEEGKFLYVAVFNGVASEKELGVMMVIPSESPLNPNEVLREISAKNPLMQLQKGIVWYPDLGQSLIRNVAIQYDNYLEVPRYYPVVSVLIDPTPNDFDALPLRADCCIKDRLYENLPAWASVAARTRSLLSDDIMFDPVLDESKGNSRYSAKSGI